MITLDLPWPPSLNRRIPKLGNRSPEVRQWVAEADGLFLATRSTRRTRGVRGPFELEMILDQTRRGRSDLDNRGLKVVLDWLQCCELIDNDALAEKITLQWGEAPEGAIVRIMPWAPAA